MSSFDTQFEAFAEQVQQELREGVTSFPTVFDLSVRVQKLADAPETSLAQIAGAVQTEPLLAAKVIRMANTLTLNPYRGQITSLSDAIQRIGLSTLRCLAFAVAAEQLARDHRSRQMRLIASGLWMHSIDVAAWSCAFAHHLKRPDPDAAMLAGLMLDIGQFYLLARAARYPALEGDMGRFAEVVTTWDEPVRDAVLEALEMPERIITACAADPFANTEWPPAELGDVVFLATLAAESPNPFDTLLGSRQRGELLEASVADGLDRDGFDTLMSEARASRQELISAACG
ncbi:MULTISPECIES: HDOD domain-containing protein [Thauera]|jgi:HD-like signal output (HDOD) protein|uniref:HDOD domain-containing protein n=2 Tax=Thauera aminoaromatica TaxID=164330 RepID=C4K9N7_THASP|nr:MULTISPECIES: HDOD domain-containing protein [Thauera]MDA0234624.1 HDOD domain-containing protein [Pseudomonadota bacterium]ACR01113.1 putative signal transduction protein [Thauera aminoaromatica]ENO83351.1 signal transduction protein [Thauera aminoaromatica S2]KIN88998.1 HDOD domain protein [Thauera sp. SWB20]TXH82750.1 MAG: HDOD domain-containing protein [Thauera aminoaromatica]